MSGLDSSKTNYFWTLLVRTSKIKCCFNMSGLDLSKTNAIPTSLAWTHQQKICFQALLVWTSFYSFAAGSALAAATYVSSESIDPSPVHWLQGRNVPLSDLRKWRVDELQHLLRHVWSAAYMTGRAGGIVQADLIRAEQKVEPTYLPTYHLPVYLPPYLLS